MTLMAIAVLNQCQESQSSSEVSYQDVKGQSTSTIVERRSWEMIGNSIATARFAGRSTARRGMPVASRQLVARQERFTAHVWKETDRR